MSRLPFQDLNEVAMVDRRCRDMRNHESLNQTRSGTIVLTRTTTTRESLRRAMLERGWNAVFSGNRTHLVVFGLKRVEQLQNWHRSHRHPNPLLPLAGVTSLKVEYNRDNVNDAVERRAACTNAFVTLIRVLPYIRELDTNYLELDKINELGTCPNLTRVTWNGCKGLNICGYDLGGAASSLQELYVDDYHVEYGGLRRDFSSFYTSETTRGYLWVNCTRLERLSMKNATWQCRDMAEPEPLYQEMLINMVRCHPTLRWLRSDLTEENVAMLKEERPEITFVTD